MEWFEYSGPSPGAREMHGSTVLDGSLLITGGRDEQGNMLDTTWKFQVTGDRKGAVF